MTLAWSDFNGGCSNITQSHGSNHTQMGPNPKGPRTQIIGLYVPNTIILMVFGP